MYKIVTYYPETNKSDIKLLMNRIVENSVSDLFTEAQTEWTADNKKCDSLEEYGLVVEDDDAQCICRKSIKSLYYVSNAKTKTSLILGSCCIKKFLPDALRCKECDTPLSNVVKRLQTNNFTCPKCERCKKFQEKLNHERKMRYQFHTIHYPGHKYHGRLFSTVIEDDDFVDDIYKNGMPWSNCADRFLDYAKWRYDFIPL